MSAARATRATGVTGTLIGGAGVTGVSTVELLSDGSSSVPEFDTTAVLNGWSGRNCGRIVTDSVGAVLGSVLYYTLRGRLTSKTFEQS